MPTLLSYRKARHKYEILEELEAGLELKGYEVKSLRNGQGSFEGAHVIIRGGEAFLVGMHISPYQGANTPDNYEPERARRLLLSRKQIDMLRGKEKMKGLTIVPLSVYTKGPFLKLSLAIVRGKKQYDKRETLKKRDAWRSIERTLKNQ